MASSSSSNSSCVSFTPSNHDFMGFVDGNLNFIPTTAMAIQYYKSIIILLIMVYHIQYNPAMLDCLFAGVDEPDGLCENS